MESKFKKLMKTVFAVCMVAVMVFDTVGSAEAAGYKKSFTKSFNMQGGTQVILYLETKKDSTPLTVTISTGKKSKDLNVLANVPADDRAGYAQLDSKHKKSSIKATAENNTPVVYITSYGSKKVKVKVKVSASTKSIKLKEKVISTGDVG